jgi:hypothetical protein
MGEAKRKREMAASSKAAVSVHYHVRGTPLPPVQDKQLMVSNYDHEDVTFEHIPHGTYNVTRGYRLAVGPFLCALLPAIENTREYITNPFHLRRITPERLEEPCLLVEQDDGRMTMIDGIHRLRRRHELGLLDFRTMIVPKELRPLIEVYFHRLGPNGIEETSRWLAFRPALLP